jgi:hypothetical protein
MQLTMENPNEYIPFNNSINFSMIDTLRSMNEDQVNYSCQLISILAICGQGENAFAQLVSEVVIIQF